MIEERIFIAGAGPVGLSAAAHLVRQGIPVTVFEASERLSEELRASTFHPPTLDMLDDLGFAKELVGQGLVAPKFQYRTRESVIAEFDFGAIADKTRHPHRLQSEQFKLTRIILNALQHEPNFRIEFGRRVEGATQDDERRHRPTDRSGRPQRGTARALADRRRRRPQQYAKLARLEFEGFTWPEQFLVVSTPYDLGAARTSREPMSPTRCSGASFLRTPGLWRMMFPMPPDVPDETLLERGIAQRACALRAGRAQLRDRARELYRVHQRVATTSAGPRRCWPATPRTSTTRSAAWA